MANPDRNPLTPPTARDIVTPPERSGPFGSGQNVRLEHDNHETIKSTPETGTQSAQCGGLTPLPTSLGCSCMFGGCPVSGYKIRNWQKFQHYKDRCPPWIKLHWEVLSSRDWVMLADDSRVLMIACMLIASRNDGVVPDDSEYIKRVAYLHKKPNFEPLVKHGFLIPLADASECLQKIANDTTETETETEAEAETNKSAVIFDTFRKQYPGRKRGNETELANFQKKHKDWRECLPGLLAALERETEWRNKAKKAGQFVPEWKNLQTWINQRCWEEEAPAIEADKQQNQRKDWNAGGGGLVL